MTLNIDLEEVPFAILEAVKARIMANRRRLQGQQPRPSLRPRPQFTKIGANSKSWRLPKHAAVVTEVTGITHFWWFNNLTEKAISTNVLSNNLSLNTTDSIGVSIAPGDASSIVHDIVSTDHSNRFPGNNPIATYNNIGRTWDVTYYEYKNLSDVSYWVLANTENCQGVIDTSVYTATGNSVTFNESRLFNVEFYNWIYNLPSGAGYLFDYQLPNIVLPAGNGCAIVIQVVYWDWFLITRKRSSYPGWSTYSGSSYDGGRSFFVYVCNSKSIRKLSISPTTMGFLDTLFPSIQTTIETITYNAYADTPSTVVTPIDITKEYCAYSSTNPYWFTYQPEYAPSFYTFGSYPFEVTDTGVFAFATGRTFNYSRPKIEYASYSPSEGYKGMSISASNSYASTPSIFKSLNSILNFVGSEEIKSFPESAYWIVEDASASLSLRTYSRYSIPGVNPDDVPGGEFNMDAELTYNIGSSAAVEFPSIDGKTPSTYDGQFFTVWDWDDSDYCQRMCLALGFSTADLEP